MAAELRFDFDDEFGDAWDGVHEAERMHPYGKNAKKSSSSSSSKLNEDRMRDLLHQDMQDLFGDDYEFETVDAKLKGSHDRSSVGGDRDVLPVPTSLSLRVTEDPASSAPRPATATTAPFDESLALFEDDDREDGGFPAKEDPRYELNGFNVDDDGHDESSEHEDEEDLRRIQNELDAIDAEMHVLAHYEREDGAKVDGGGEGPMTTHTRQSDVRIAKEGNMDGKKAVSSYVSQESRGDRDTAGKSQSPSRSPVRLASSSLTSKLSSQSSVSAPLDVIREDGDVAASYEEKEEEAGSDEGDGDGEGARQSVKKRSFLFGQDLPVHERMTDERDTAGDVSLRSPSSFSSSSSPSSLSSSSLSASSSSSSSSVSSSVVVPVTPSALVEDKLMRMQTPMVYVPSVSRIMMDASLGEPEPEPAAISSKHVALGNVETKSLASELPGVGSVVAEADDDEEEENNAEVIPLISSLGKRGAKGRRDGDKDDDDNDDDNNNNDNDNADSDNDVRASIDIDVVSIHPRPPPPRLPLNNISKGTKSDGKLRLEQALSESQVVRTALRALLSQAQALMKERYYEEDFKKWRSVAGTGPGSLPLSPPPDGATPSESVQRRAWRDAVVREAAMALKAANTKVEQLNDLKRTANDFFRH